MTRIRKPITVLATLLIALAGVGCVQTTESAPQKEGPAFDGPTEVALLAGGCFWCVESGMDKLPGVIEAVSGYTDGDEVDPTYQEVSSGTTGHTEAVEVTFDPARISYAEILEAFWRLIDPTDAGGQFADRGSQYRTGIYFYNEEQRRLAEASKAELDAGGKFKVPIVVPIKPAKPFYAAEEYHQNYSVKHPREYNRYFHGSGRGPYIARVWGDLSVKPGKSKPKKEVYVKPTNDEIKKKLTPLQYSVTQEEGTERAFNNEYWDNKEEGIYVDIVSGEPLFSSTHKYESGTGWPSFFKPLEPANVVEKEDRKLFMSRTEVRSKHGDSHLGHLFPDGPEPTGQRYCINSASLRFIPRADLEKEGYGEYAKLFE